MNKLLKLIILLFLLFGGGNIYAQVSSAGSDTINVVDASKLKQGYWIVKSNSKTVEEGRYVDNMRNGVWTFYFPSGKLKCTITYLNDKAKGHAKLYYEDGKLAEEGTWMENKWVGKYLMNYPNGQLAYDWNFDVTGKRTGVQRYFYDNGQPMYEGEWTSGKNSGNLTMFDDKGVKIGERVYNDAGFASTIMNNGAPKDSIMPADTDFRDFNLTGNSTIVNFSGKVDKSGYFDKGKLMNGTKFEYDENNVLVRKVLYRDGEVFKTIEMKKP